MIFFFREMDESEFLTDNKVQLDDFRSCRSFSHPSPVSVQSL